MQINGVFTSSAATYQILFNNEQDEQVGGFAVKAEITGSGPFTQADYLARMDTAYQTLGNLLAADFYPAGTVAVLARAFSPDAGSMTDYEPV